MCRAWRMLSVSCEEKGKEKRWTRFGFDYP